MDKSLVKRTDRLDGLYDAEKQFLIVEYEPSSSIKSIAALTLKKRQGPKSQAVNIGATMLKGFETMDKFEAIGKKETIRYKCCF
ncbi:unnamed protein product [Cylicocyclus nassatus]|uniref:Uncharacterized protein n=1 Tax=Cylicocyclus nassatus TaxID=53992 RepID=A0AA36GFI3_CYLNA|nr:unnamed protein product [Cylicocyclus nassatus]